MDQNQQPHSRDKKTGTGSANVQKGNRVSTGQGPAGGRPEQRRPAAGGGNAARPERSAGNAYTTQRSSSPLSIKKILIIAAVVLIAFFILKNCAGIELPEGTYNDPYTGSGYTDSGYSGQGYDSFYSAADTDENHYSYASSSSAVLNRNVSSLARDKYVTPAGNGSDTVTVMIYMCGSDLESKYGMASKDLQEMLNAKMTDKVNVIIETGGCSKWQNTLISAKTNQVYRINNGNIYKLEDNFGSDSMTDPQNLSKFIKYCTENWPANRNILIFWDHGGGSVSGYGHDEKNPSSSSMTLEKIGKALKNGGCKFDIIGFDACLMATFETALVCDGYADYLLASEETEPGTGWYYTRWLTELSDNTGLSSLDLGKIIVDDFITSSVNASTNAKVTLSLIDLSELHGTVPDAFKQFASSTNELIRNDDNGYRTVSEARAGTRQFAQKSKINQVDFIHLANNINTKESRALASVLQECVKYNRASMSDCYGISIFFPYENTNNVKSAVASYDALGMDDEYTECIKSFVSLETAGQASAYASSSYAGSAGDILGSFLSGSGGEFQSSSLMDSLLGTFLGGSSSETEQGGLAGVSDILSMLSSFRGRSLPASMDYLDTDLIADHAEQIAGDRIDPSRITVSYRDGQPVLSLTDEEWSRIATVELSLFARDEDGYIDLGRDNVFTIDNNDLLLGCDGTWLCVNGNVCAYYMISDTKETDGTYTTVGRIPAYLNGTLVDLQVVFDRNDPYGKITGAYPAYNGSVGVEAKGLVKILPGDTLQFICDHYTFDREYEDSYTLSSPFTVPSAGLELENLKLEADGLLSLYCLTDYYGNVYFTPALEQ